MKIMTPSRGSKVENVLSKEDRKASQGYVDLKSKTLEQLNEMIERQNKLLQNRSFLEKLPDKGKKILSFKAELEGEYRKRQEEYDTACQLLYNLSLNDKSAEELEWNQGKVTTSKSQLDSDDEDEEEKEIDPLKLVATHSGTARGKNIKMNHDVENGQKNLYVDKFCEKYGKLINSKERFKPNQLKNNDKTVFVRSAEKVKDRLGNKWEITEATPPVPVYKDTVMISLAESLNLQKRQAEKLKEIEKTYATEKLLQNMSVKMGDKLPVNNITEYRSSSNYFDESAVDEEENECKDSDSEDREKTVCFPIENSED